MLQEVGEVKGEASRLFGGLVAHAPELEGEKEVATRTITVESQHANCPDAQCPRAKVYNVGYVAQGYNLVYGNPFPTSGGIDPGFKNFGGSKIFQVTYDQNRETVDGREEVPDDIIVMAEHGCTLQMSLEEASNSDDYQKMVQESDSYGGSVGIKGFSASGKASKETMEAEQKMEEKNTVITYATAMCDAFRVSMNKYSGRPKFTSVFTKSALAAKEATEEVVRQKAFYDLFDLFGTHYIQSLTLGSKFTLEQEFEATKWMELTESSGGQTLGADVGFEIELKKKAKAKKAKKKKKGCDTDPPLKRQNAMRNKKRDKDPCVMSNLDWIKQAWGLMLSKIGTIEAELKIESKNEESQLDSLEQADESMSREIISIGAPPSDDPLEWAQQTLEEAMPIKYTLAPICELFLAEEPDLLKPQQQAKEMLGGISPQDSTKMVVDCEQALYQGYCKDRVSPRSGAVCEGKLAQRKTHTCSDDTDCNTGDQRHYECVENVCQIPYSRIVSLQLVGASSKDAVPECPADYEVVKKHSGQPAQIGCPPDDSSCTTFSHLCVLRKDSRIDASSTPVCQLFLTGSMYAEGLHCEYTDECMTLSTDPERAKPYKLRRWNQCNADRTACREGHDSKTHLKLVTYDNCVDCDSRKTVSGGNEKFLFYESKTCENYEMTSTCRSFVAYDSCDLSQVDHTMNNLGVSYQCDSGENVIPAGMSGFCECTRNKTENYDSNRFFCGHEPMSCVDWCASKNPLPGLTDLIAAEGSCPPEYSKVWGNYGGMSNNLYAGTASVADKKLVLCASYSYTIDDTGGGTTTLGELERENPTKHEHGGALSKAVVEHFVEHGAPRQAIRRHAQRRGSDVVAAGKADADLEQLASVIKQVLDVPGTSFLEEEEEEGTEEEDETETEEEEEEETEQERRRETPASIAAAKAAAAGLKTLHATAKKPSAAKMQRARQFKVLERRQGGHQPQSRPSTEESTPKSTASAVGPADGEALIALDAAFDGDSEWGTKDAEDSDSEDTEERRRRKRDLKGLDQVEDQEEDQMERTSQGMNANVAASLSAANSPPGDSKIIVRSQSAVCPDAQCPRAKVVNLGYLGKGYNLLYANPHPKKSGIDPGFTEYGGADIFNLTYEKDNKKETPDGRYEVPNALDVSSEFGCSLSFSSKFASTVTDYQNMERDSTSVSASLNVGPFFSASFKASKEFQKNQNRLTSGEKTTVNSEARCTAYSARYASATPQEIAKFTDGFTRAIQYLIATQKKDIAAAKKDEAWYESQQCTKGLLQGRGPSLRAHRSPCRSSSRSSFEPRAVSLHAGLLRHLWDALFVNDAARLALLNAAGLRQVGV